MFGIEPEDIPNRMIQFQVFSVDKYARHKVIGESEIRLGDIDLRMPIKMWLNLRDIDEVFYSTFIHDISNKLVVILINR